MLKEILLIIGFLALLEGTIVILFPKSVGKALRKISKKKKLIEAAAMEIIASLVLIAIGFIIS